LIRVSAISLALVTNVAYLDFQPVTLAGRMLAGILQLCGIAFIGVFTASLAGAIVREPGPQEGDAAKTHDESGNLKP
jgi:hypothetical protein